MRARDLFYAMWISDLFMKRVEENSTWTLMCPNECPGLYDCHGNVAEWTDSVKGNRRITKGGSWLMESESTTSTSQ